MKIIKIKKHLVSCASEKLPEKPSFKGIEPIYRSIELADLDRDVWLGKRKRAFSQFIAEGGHLGYQLIDPQTNESIAYAWTAVNGSKPGHLPTIPLGVAWGHYNRVRDGYQGRGYYKLLLFNQLTKIRKKFKNILIYSDTSENNFAARTVEKKLGFKEAGIYHVITIGTKRIPYLYWQWGKWNCDEKHPPLKGWEDK